MVNRDIQYVVSPYISHIISFKDDIKTFIYENIEDFVDYNNPEQTKLNISLYTSIAVEEYVENLTEYISELVGGIAKAAIGLGVAGLAIHAAKNVYGAGKRQIDRAIGPSDEDEDEKLKHTAREALIDDIKRKKINPTQYAGYNNNYQQ